MPISTRAVVQSSIAILAIALTALLAIVAATIWLGERARHSFADVIAARDIRVWAVDLRNALQTAESSQRGYIATSNEIYLAPYDRSKTQALRQLHRLQQADLRLETPALLERLSVTITSKVEEMDRSIELKSSGNDDEALALLRTNRGKALMDEADVYVAGIVRAADDRLIAAADEQTANATLLRWGSGLGACLIILVVGGLVGMVRKYTREITTARDEVRAVNATLEDRVERRTAELARERDRARMLLAEVNHRVANSLALVASLIRMQNRALADRGAKEALDEASARIEAVSLVHKRLYSAGDVKEIALDEYVSGLLEQIQASMRKEGRDSVLVYELEPLKTGADATVNLGIVLAEWVTNAFKYAYPQGDGQVRVFLNRQNASFGELIVEDDGVGRVEGVVKGTGLGSRIVAAMAESMQAKVEYASKRPGTVARLAFPIDLAGSKAA